MKPRTRIKRESAKHASERAERRAVVDAVMRRDNRQCQARDLVPDVKCRWPLDPHEIIPRSAWRAGYLVVENVIAVCAAHHDWIGDHPADAHAVGLHGYSWERSQ